MASATKFILALLLAVVAGFGGLILLLVLALKFVDWSEHKDVLVNLTERYSDWQVEQLGDVEIELYFPTKVRLTNTELTQQAPDSALASVSADSFAISLNPLSLFLQERPVIHNIEASAARIVAEAPEQPPKDTDPLTIPHIEAARVKDSWIVYRGDSAQQDLNLHLAALNIDSQDEGEGLSVSGKGKLAVSGKGKLDVPGNESLELNFAGTVGALRKLSEGSPLPFDLEGSIAEDDFSVQGQVVTGQQVSGRAQLSIGGDGLPRVAEAFGISLGNVPSYALNLSISGSPEQISAEDIQARLGESSLSGRASLQLQNPKPYLRATLSSSRLRPQDWLSLIPEGTTATNARGSQPASRSGAPQLDMLNALNARVSYSSSESQGDRTQLNAILEDGQLDVTGRVDSENLKLTLEGLVGPRQGGADAPLLPFSLGVVAAGDTFSTEGRITVENQTIHLRAESSAEGKNLASIAQLFDLNLADVPPYELNFDVSGPLQQINFEDIQATLGGSDLYGDITLQRDQAKPYLHADMGSSLLREQDLRSLIPEGPEQPDTSQAPQLEFLEAVNADLSFAIAELEGELLGQSSGGDLKAALENGELELAGQIGVRDLELRASGNLGPTQPGGEATLLPFDLEVTAADDNFSSEGQITLAKQTFTFSTDSTATGNSLAQLAALFEISLSDPPPYKLSFSANKSASEISVGDIQLTLGRSYLYGNGALQLDGPRPYLSANLGISLLRQQDLMGLIPDNGDTDDEHVFSREPLNLAVMRRLDAELRLALGAYEGATGEPLISGMAVRGHLEDGRLALDPIDISLAGGTVDGHLQLDSRNDPATLTVDLAAESVQLNDLISPFFDLEEEDMEVRGGMDANLEVTSSGNSLHDWASHVKGKLNWAIYDGVLPAVIVEAVGLDPTEAAISWFSDNVATSINCGVGQFPIVSGVVGTETFLLSTEDSNIVGDGAISLAEETVNYQLESHAKDFSILASGSPIQIEGALNNISIDVGSGELLANLGASAALALINPALAAIPFIELGTGETGECRELQQELRQIKEESDEEGEE